MRRLRNPALSPAEMAQELAAYLNTDVDPYDFGGYLLERWQEEDPEQIDAAESRRGGGLVEQVDDLEDDERARFKRWLTERGPHGRTPLGDEIQDDPLGVPSYLFRNAYPLGEGAWCVHFTKRAFSSFNQGATLPMLGLSTHYRQKASVDCSRNLDDSTGLYERVYGFAFEALELKHPRAAARKYGEAAVLFQTDAGVSAYHTTDDEQQVIFPLCSEWNVHEITFEAGSRQVWLTGPASADGEEPFDSIADAIAHIEAQEAEPLRAANPVYRALPLAEVRRWRPVAARQGVSEVARAPGGFLPAYEAAGGRLERMSPWWRARRQAFLARHLAQVAAHHEPLFDGKGRPTRRHLALVMWAYSPEPSRLSRL